MPIYTYIHINIRYISLYVVYTEYCKVSPFDFLKKTFKFIVDILIRFLCFILFLHILHNYNFSIIFF